MIRKGHENTDFFVGTEVEHTAAFGKKTLFVVGVKSIEEIQKWLDHFSSIGDVSTNIEHIFFGADQSFPILDVNDSLNWAHWEDMIAHFLDQGYLCTLDLDVRCVEGLAESGLTDCSTFIPMISVKLPYTRLLNYNTTIKIDDKGFNATNPGVWCHSLHNLMDRNLFTPWSDYSKDQTL